MKKGEMWEKIKPEVMLAWKMHSFHEVDLVTK